MSGIINTIQTSLTKPIGWDLTNVSAKLTNPSAPTLPRPAILNVSSTSQLSNSVAILFQIKPTSSEQNSLNPEICNSY